jgi:hypothetical protein
VVETEEAEHTNSGHTADGIVRLSLRLEAEGTRELDDQIGLAPGI